MTDDTPTEIDAAPDIVDLDGSAAVDDLSDLEPDDYRRAAELMAEQADQGQQDATDAEPDLDPRDQRYRQRWRSAQADVDRLRALVEAMQADEVARLAAGRLADPTDLFRDGATVANLCDDDGRVDPARVDAAIHEVLQAHPHWALLSPYRGPLRSGAAPIRLEPPNKTFADAFTPAPSE
ncbi:hypothetical protein PUR22_21335 [Mycolicibacterium porcinum]|uniref:hypothetical protein n=1 Tax=Mycolicibacterium porcinum TaxID=39693 RepID=UPI0031F9C081